MSVRQYIGARYVPRFSTVNGGVWDNTYSYEALEIVKYGNDYYTSKKPVPTGVAITNTDYWVLTGNYNGAIATLDSKVTELQNDIEPLITATKIIVAGDSYGVVDGSWVPEFTDRIHSLYPNAVITNTCIGGKAAADSSYNDCISSRPIDEDVTAVILCGGYNEGVSTPESQIRAGLVSFFNLARTKYPNAKQYIGFIGNNKISTNDGATKRLYLANTALPAYRSMESYGVKYLTGVENIMHNTEYFVNDNVHPNIAGGVALGDGIYNAFIYGSYYFTLPINLVAITYNSNINSAGNELTLSCTLLNDIIAINVNKKWRCVFVNPVDISYTQSITIGTYNNRYLLPDANDLAGIPCTIVAITPTDRVLLSGYISFNRDKTITIELYQGGAINGVTSLFITLTNNYIPTMYS